METRGTLGAAAQETSPDHLLATPPEGSEARWCCLYTRPRHEKSLAWVCEREGASCYLPLRTAVRQYRSGRKERQLPLFPGYLFCRADPEQRHTLKGHKNLLSLLDVYDQEGLLADLREVHKAFAASQELQTVPYLKVGQRVQITAGPFRGISGVVSDLRSRFRVFLNVAFINQSVPLEVDARSVEACG